MDQVATFFHVFFSCYYTFWAVAIRIFCFLFSAESHAGGLPKGSRLTANFYNGELINNRLSCSVVLLAYSNGAVFAGGSALNLKYIFGNTYNWELISELKLTQITMFGLSDTAPVLKFDGIFTFAFVFEFEYYRFSNKFDLYQDIMTLSMVLVKYLP